MNLLSVMLALTAYIVFEGGAMSAVTHQNEPPCSSKQILVPVYYVSDRRPTAISIGDWSPDQLIGAQHITRGKVMVLVSARRDSDIPGSKHSAHQNNHTNLGWLTSSDQINKIMPVEQQLARQSSASMNIGANGGNTTLFMEPFMTDFLADFAKVVDQLPNKRFILFTHGCCISQKDSFKRAAELVAASELPILMFDWATPGRFEAPVLPELNSYRRSERVLEISQYNFSCFVTALTNALPDANCVFVGHSMGNRLILTDLLQRCSETDLLFEQVHMVRPDLSLPAYLLEQFRTSRFAKRVYVYMANNDPWLKWAQGISAGVPRLGCPAGLLEVAIRQGMTLDSPSNRYFLDVADLRIGHAIPFNLLSQIIRFGTGDIPEAAFALSPVSDDYSRGHLIRVYRR